MKHNFLIRSALLTAAFTSVAAMGQEAPGGLAFDASKHQKSQGAQLSVTYPAGFSARESNRQRIVQSFVGSSDGVDLAMTLGVEALSLPTSPPFLETIQPSRHPGLELL